MIKKEPIRLACERGFCAGVRGALSLFDRTLEAYGAPLYVLDELVHNVTVTESLRSRGAIFVASLGEVPAGATLLLGAHGVPAKTLDDAEKRHLSVVDATCPLVRKLQSLAAAIAPERDLILFGDAAHPEMKGVAARSGTKKIHFVASVEEIDALPANLNAPFFLSQTTRNFQEIRAVAEKLKSRFPQLEDHAGACNAVMARQNAVRELAKHCEIVLICGSKHSSNALRLKEIASECGAKSFLLEEPSQLPGDELKCVRCVGISSGASTPEESVQKIVDALHTMGFPLPEESR